MDQRNHYYPQASQTQAVPTQPQAPAQATTPVAPAQQQAAYYPPAAYPQHQAMYPPQAYYQMPPQQVAPNNNLLGFANERFFKGLLIGAAATYVLTNENVQRTAIKGAVKAWSLLQGGVEEIKERFHDAEAEIRSEHGD